MYGVRGIVKTEETPIKFEIITEGRMTLDYDGPLIDGVKVTYHYIPQEVLIVFIKFRH